MPNQHGDNSQFDTLSALTVSTTRSRLSSTRRLSVELVTTSSRHLTAWQCLVQVAGLTASAGKLRVVRALGVDVVLDYAKDALGDG